jgi:isoquinoline 1-oxidoreductase subunit alpha
MTSYSFTLNGKPVKVEVAPSTPLLWAIRDHLGLTGTKFGCGIAQCGACTVHVDGQAVRSCSYAIDAVEGAAVTTIEGLTTPVGTRLKQAWVENQVPQCGYCQPGMIMAAAALLQELPHPSQSDIEAGITNICRCGTYSRIRRAILAASKE